MHGEDKEVGARELEFFKEVESMSGVLVLRGKGLDKGEQDNIEV